jgi:hypothetical protein
MDERSNLQVAKEGIEGKSSGACNSIGILG